MSNDDEPSVLEMYQKMLNHSAVQANPGAKQYVQDQLDLLQRELPPRPQAALT